MTTTRTRQRTCNATQARFSLASVLLVVTFVAIACTLGRFFGIYGWIAAFEAVVILMGIAHVLRLERILGVRVWQITISEMVVCLGVGALLFSLLMPAVQSSGRRRLPAAGVAAPAVPVATATDPSSVNP